MVRLPSLALAVSALTVTGIAAVPAARPRATLVLSPTFFPGWQARGVFHPFVLHDARKAAYTMYYSGKGSVQIGDSLSDTWATGMVTSKNGRDWQFPDDYEPVLLPRRFLEGDVVDRDASSSVFDSLFAFGACVLREGSAFRMWYTGWNGDTSTPDAEGRAQRLHFRIGLASSRDGLSWKKQPGEAGGGAVLGLGGRGQPDAESASHPSVLAEAGGYRMWYECDDGRLRRICAARSADGLAWTTQGVVLDPGGSGAADERGVGNPLVIRRKARYELWYQGKSRMAPTSHVLRATSPDGSVWTKAGEVPLHPQPPVSGDEEIHVDSILVKADGACQVFFAKEITATRSLVWGKVDSRSFHIFSETVRP